MDAQSARVQLAGYHIGEIEVQRRAGVQQKAYSIQGLFATRPVSEQLQSFFGTQRFLYTATRGEHGRLWASVLFGKPCFIQIPNAYEAVIAPLMQFDGDPAQYTTGSSVATVGVMFENRRRNLINGIVASNNGGELCLNVYQAFGNCPKYIQVRDLGTGSLGFGDYPSKPTKVNRGQSELHAEQQTFIARADTFFVATVHMASAAEVGMPDGLPINHINHKGGYPGFVQVAASGQLSWGDYAGNNVFSTLGNLILDPHAALLFIDFTTGDTLHLSGRAEVRWDQVDLPGAQRTIIFQTEEWVHVKGALPIKQQGPVESSPYNPTPPSKPGNLQASDMQHLQCLSTQHESLDVMTFEFELPQLPANKSMFCHPGQFASFDFEDIIPGKVLNRTWTISSPTEQIRRRKAFTISVKKDGLVSNWLFNNMRPGKTIGFKGVDGNFTLELIGSMAHSRTLLVAGGIGITPMRVLLAEQLVRQQPTTLLYFVRSLAEAPFLNEFIEAAHSNSAPFTLAVSVTRPTEQDSGHIFSTESGSGVSWFQGRITADMVAQVCPDITSCLVFQCGPAPMTQLVSATLESLQTPMTHVFQEAFNF